MKKQEGFLILEVIVAIALFSIMISGMMKESTMYARTNTDMVIKNAAGLAAQYVFDDLRYDDVTLMPSSPSSPETYNVTVDNYAFVVTITYCTVSTYCTSSARHLLAEVSYNSTKYYEMETVYTDI